MFTFEKIPEFKTDTLVLKSISRKDIQELNEIISYRLGARPDDDPLKKLERIDIDFKAKTAINWGIYTDNELIGSCGFYRGFKNNTGEIGYVLREKYRGKGYMSKAVQRIVKFGFEELKLDRITAYTDVDNAASIGLLLKMGFNKATEKHPKWEVFEISTHDR